MTDYTNCKGCRSYKPEDIVSVKNALDSLKLYATESYISTLINSCDYMKFNHDGECPCTLCIIKVMCDNSCDSFDYFMTMYKDKESILIKRENNKGKILYNDKS